MAKLFDILKNFRLTRNNKTTDRLKRGFGRIKDFNFDMSRNLEGYKLSYNTLYYAYRTNADVYGCIREWTENVGAAGYDFQVPDEPEKEVSEPVKRELDDIFNFDKPWRETKNHIVRDLGVAANAYLLKLRSVGNNNVIGLQVLDPRTMSVITDKYGTILKYRQEVPMTGSAFIFEPEEIIHIKYGVDPDHEVLGFSPMETVIWEARTDLAAMVANYGFFENSAIPSAIYILEEGMSNEEQQAAISLLKKEFKGSKNRHKGGVLAGIKDIKTLNLSQKDMEFIEGRKFNTEKICSAYGVPKFFLGITETVNNNNAVELRKGAFEGTFKPIEDLIAETITQQLLDSIGLKGQVEFIFKPQRFEQQEQLEERGIRMFKAGVLTLRQFKKMIGQEVTPEDEVNPNIDAYIVHQGISDVLLEEVGIMPEHLSDYQKAENLINEKTATK